ncbi:hypothetical protein [Streptomyces sp. NPDC058307]|uniref:hypothetical protein n=1 Tax=Streptomyces sp. NPDC058307 TaxID=3346439 RepID=UPI0036E1BFE8
MDFSVVAVAREDDSAVEEPVRVAVAADRLGYGEVGAGEGPTRDSFVLATAIGQATERVALTGPVPMPMNVRDAYTTARGAGFGEAVRLAVGGADRETPVRALAERARAPSGWWTTWTSYGRGRTPTGRPGSTRSLSCRPRPGTRAANAR